MVSSAKVAWKTMVRGDEKRARRGTFLRCRHRRWSVRGMCGDAHSRVRTPQLAMRRNLTSSSSLRRAMPPIDDPLAAIVEGESDGHGACDQPLGAQWLATCGKVKGGHLHRRGRSRVSWTSVISPFSPMMNGTILSARGMRKVEVKSMRGVGRFHMRWDQESMTRSPTRRIALAWLCR